MSLATLYDVPAPAKVNLFLHVVGRRADGYHLLQTVFRFIDLADTLNFERRADGVIERAYELPGVAPEQDLVVRAARALQQATGTAFGARIGLVKRIPQGGGLGGGSSDAATTLIALNRLWNTGLSRRQLMALALPLGADVPVFVFGQPAFAQGVGEDLSAVVLPEAGYLVAQPDISVPTAAIFGAPDLTRDTKPVKIADFLALPSSGFGKNDLEPAAAARYPEIVRCGMWLEARLRVIESQAMEGRGFQFARQAVRMSGSGACLFVEFATQAQALLAQQEITATMRVAGVLENPSINRQDLPDDNLAPEFRLIQACAGLAEHPLWHWIAS
ncbi:MAG TPA: 4-(cytidine 5'-diphospho)-2-C-methyl-D-erythritol kinase [Bordetella sp.]